SLLEQSRSIGESDMLIVCELPSYVIEVTEAASQIASRGTQIAAITDSPAAPVCAHASMHFYVSDNSPLFGSSLIGSMFAVHVLTSILAKEMGNEGRRALEEQKEGLNDERIYYPSYGLRY
ncbi:MAG: SIS domain-containing protein, partial [Synergistaceae bacterium]|nr:SIS domain-containing protein [Synergistaceae bacterium]